MTRSILLIITIINMLFQFVYLTFGRVTELGIFIYVFYVFRPEYVIVSGVIAFIILCVWIVLFTIKLLRHGKDKMITDIIGILLNIEYLLFYCYVLSIR